MSNTSKFTSSKSKSRPTRRGKKITSLHNFEEGTRWVVRPDGESYGSFASSHDSLARSAGYRDEDQAYSDGALRVHYDPSTNAVRVEARKATMQAIALAKQIINKVPASMAHVSVGEGKRFRSYIGEPSQVSTDMSLNRASTLARWQSNPFRYTEDAQGSAYGY